MNNYMPTNRTIWTKWVNFQKHNLPKLKQEESENLNTQITNSKMEAVNKKNPKK